MQQKSLQIQLEEEQDRIASAREDFEIDAAYATPEIQDETSIKETNPSEESATVNPIFFGGEVKLPPPPDFC